MDGCREVDMENLIQCSNASPAYDVTWSIETYHHVVGNKLHNPCNNSCTNERAKYTPMTVDKKVTGLDLNHMDQTIIEPMHEQ